MSTVFSFDLAELLAPISIYSIAEVLYGEGFQAEKHTSRQMTYCNIFGEWEKRMHLWLHFDELSLCVGILDCE